MVESHAWPGGVLVAPAVPGPPDDVAFPWRIEAEGAVFALDLQRSIPVELLLERTGRLTITTAATVQRALRHVM